MAKRKEMTMQRRELLKFGTAAAASAALSPLAAAGGISASDVMVRWLGGATLEFAIGDITILADPCLGDGIEAFEMGDPNEMFDLSAGPNIKMHERLTPFPGMAMSEYDIVLLSHAHEDHFDQKAQAWLGSSGPVLCSAQDVTALRKKGFAAQVLNHGQKRVFRKGDTEVSITSIPAVHSLNTAISGILGLGNGYWLQSTVRNKTSNIYWAGDTFMVDPVWEAVQQLPAPDLFIPHIGAVGVNGALGQLSMSGHQAVEFAKLIKAGLILPAHHSTYALYQEPVSTMIEAYAMSGIPSVLKVLSEGSLLTI
ncbi:MBL fold metallo-hydrolase [Rhodobacteraceae bacterium B1Z28]|uniref:MBL fold metallo-hydrolase n=1 Tax=Ruegeria haliotis TaxID=2747601 RepID=A0ABX2PRZ8_9RHOB|nr:MBL fold metallo-hydrolase [Ruegeria haliotis]NVO56940.1 MBL fold metallo-hydrolase [Ruegeria haliotis]